MGYELWISHETGIRRKGTTFKELQEIFINKITTEYIFETLYSWKDSANMNYLSDEMNKKDFDVVGLINKNKIVIGYIEKSNLEDNGQLKILDFTNKNVILSSTPIVSLIERLSQNPYLFISKNGKIEGIVTRADINKPIVRIYLFSIISLMEMHLNYWINHHHENSWEAKLAEKRIESAKKIFEERTNENSELSLLDCIQFCDKRDILLNTLNFLETFNFSKKRFKKTLNYLEDIRNELAHSQNKIIPNQDWERFGSTINTINVFLTQSESTIEEMIKDKLNK